jgi:hypothetical protein
VLEGGEWSFDVRHDGKAYFPTNQSGTNGEFGTGSIYDNTDVATLTYSGDTDTGEVFEDVDLAGFRMGSTSIKSRIKPTGSDFGNTSWGITSVTYGATEFTLALDNSLFFTPISDSTWTSYCNEVVLPSTVKEVMSASNRGLDVALRFIDRSVGFDTAVPRPDTVFNSSPEIIYVGSTVTSTSLLGTWPNLSNATATTGTGMMIWPVPSQDIWIDYSYRQQHVDLAAATDLWTNVPDDVLRVIQKLALQNAFSSSIRNDVRMSAKIQQENAVRWARAIAKHDSQPNLRRVPPSFGHRMHHGNIRARWETQLISAS